MGEGEGWGRGGKLWSRGAAKFIVAIMFVIRICIIVYACVHILIMNNFIA